MLYGFTSNHHFRSAWHSLCLVSLTNVCCVDPEILRSSLPPIQTECFYIFSGKAGRERPLGEARRKRGGGGNMWHKPE